MSLGLDDASSKAELKQDGSKSNVRYEQNMKGGETGGETDNVDSACETDAVGVTISNPEGQCRLINIYKLCSICARLRSRVQEV